MEIQFLLGVNSVLDKGEDLMIVEEISREVIKAVKTEPLPTYHVFVEHNTWEVESWCFAFPATERVKEAMESLKKEFERNGRYTSRFTHYGVRNGDSSATIFYDCTELSGFIFKECARKMHYPITGRGRVAHYYGGSYMGNWNVVTDDENEAVEILRCAKDYPPYKGFATLSEYKEAYERDSKSVKM